MKLTLKEAEAIMEKNDGNLNLSYTEVDELPNNLKVKGSLYLSGTPITKLQDDLDVCGVIDLKKNINNFVA